MGTDTAEAALPNREAAVMNPFDTRHPPAGSEDRQPDYDLMNALSIYAWLERPLPTLKRLLGDVVTQASRVFIVGATGIGKTLFVHGVAGAFADGKNFLHWKCDGPASVLIVDGEMSERMTKKRAQLLNKRYPNIPPTKLMIYSMQLAQEFARRFPQLGQPSPLNTAEGQDWLLNFIALVKPDVVILDNVMSLLAGVMKEEEPWVLTVPLVLGISALGIAQIWLDHTGWNTDRQYGGSVKAWLFDAVGVLLRPPAAAIGERETVFDISFDPPGGKARNRDPDNWHDFAPHRIRLTAEGWQSEPLDPAAQNGVAQDPRFGKLGPEIRQMFSSIENLLAAGSGEMVTPEPGMQRVNAITRRTLRASNIRLGWHREGDIAQLSTSEGQVESDPTLTQRGMDYEHKALTRLKDKGLIGFTRERVWLL
jgi:hypothetical protein